LAFDQDIFIVPDRRNGKSFASRVTVISLAGFDDHMDFKRCPNWNSGDATSCYFFDSDRSFGF
jgi:hypothetical protein